MKIQSRVENPKPASRYKDHKETPVLHHTLGKIDGTIHVASAYIPEPFDPPSAVPFYGLVFGMDNRRYLLKLSHDEAVSLKNQLNAFISANKPRQVK